MSTKKRNKNPYAPKIRLGLEAEAYVEKIEDGRYKYTINVQNKEDAYTYCTMYLPLNVYPNTPSHIVEERIESSYHSPDFVLEGVSIFDYLDEKESYYCMTRGAVDYTVPGKRMEIAHMQFMLRLNRKITYAPCSSTLYRYAGINLSTDDYKGHSLEIILSTHLPRVKRCNMVKTIESLED